MPNVTRMLNRGHNRFIQEYTRLVTTRNLTLSILVLAFIGILSQAGVWR